MSGFESSANFVEEQKQGVFRKTLRNMLIGVVIFNPLIALAVLNTMDIPAIAQAKDFLLSEAAFAVGGHLFQYFIIFDAFLVLAGAVLTAYVGVSGLLSRMSADGCVPGFLSKQNSKGSHPYIVLAFFLLCSSILVITYGNLLSLAGVYTIAFLGVMSMFAFGNLILRQTRSDLKRTYQAPLIFVILAFTVTFFGIWGNIRIDENNLHFFEIYFFPALLLVFAVVYQDRLMQYLLHITRKMQAVNNYLQIHFRDLIKGEYIAFIHNTERTFSILSYIDRNEVGRNVTLIHCKCDDHLSVGQGAEEIKTIVDHSNRAGAFPNLKISVKYVDKVFSPQIIDEISKETGVRRNRIFIGSIHQHHPFNYSDLGGVRIIF